MKIDYNILWVEDDQSWYESTYELFRGTLEEEGFDLKSERKDNIQQIKDMIDTDGLKKFDMLLVDFTLKNSDSGDEIIKLIRNNSIYTDVLFYSSAVDNIKDSISKHGLEGVYTADRKNIEDKFNHVFSTTIKKIQEVNSIRGLITGETSELDVEIENLVMLLVYEHLKLSENEIDKIINFYVDDFLRKSPDYFLKEYNKFGFKNWFHRIEAKRKWNIFRDLLKKIENDNVKLFLKLNQTYYDEVIDIRNRFAHAKAEEKNDKMILKGQLGKEDFEFDEEKCIKIRKNLIAHRNNINKLKSFLESVKT